GPRHRQNTGRAEISSGVTMLDGRDAYAPPRRNSIVSVQTDCSEPASGKHCWSTRASIPSSASGSGTSTIVLDGWRSARPCRTSCAAGSHSSGTHAMCVITLVRIAGSKAPSPVRRVESSRSISAIVVIASVVAPRPTVAMKQVVGRGRPPCSGGVVREVRTVALPRRHHRVDELPLLLDLVRAREQRRVAEHRVEDEPLV